MDQKNTIVKCKAHPNCLFNYNGVCDNYVINIGADGKCEGYVETEQTVDSFNELGSIYPASPKEIQLHENAKKMLKAAGIIILPAQEEAKRGQRAKGNFYEDGEVDPEIVDEVCQPFKMKVAELDKSNKNKSIIKDVVPECDLPICDFSCKHALRSGPSFNPKLWCDKMECEPAVGLFCSDYKEDKPIVKMPEAKNMDIHFVIQNAQWNEEFLRHQMCWYCDNGLHGECKLTAKPELDRTGKCPRYKSTGGNR